MKSLVNAILVALIVLLCFAAFATAGDCRSVLQVQSYAAPVQFQQAEYVVAQPQFVQRVVQPAYAQRVQAVQIQQVYQPQRVQFVQRVQVVQPQRVIVRERVIDNGDRRNVQVGLFNFGR